MDQREQIKADKNCQCIFIILWNSYSSQTAWHCASFLCSEAVIKVIRKVIFFHISYSAIFMSASKSLENSVRWFCSHHMKFEYLIPKTVLYLQVLLLNLISLVHSRSGNIVFVSKPGFEREEKGWNNISATSFEGKKYFTLSVISTDYKTVCSVYLKLSPQQLSFKSTACH